MTRFKFGGRAVCVDELDGPAKSAGLFVFACARAPLDVVDLSITEEVGEFLLPKAEIYIQLVMTESVVLCEYDDHIFECHLSSGEPVGGGDEFSGGIGLIGVAQVGLRDGIILPARLAVGVIENADRFGGLSV